MMEVLFANSCIGFGRLLRADPSPKSQMKLTAFEEVFRKLIGDGLHEGNAFAVKPATGLGNTTICCVTESRQPNAVCVISFTNKVSFVVVLLTYTFVGEI